MDTSPAQVAVASALSGKWDDAIKANLKIIEANPEDTEALCRLAHAYSETGRISDAKMVTNQVLKIDPTNLIALKFLEKLKVAKSGNNQVSSPIPNESFLEEPGKTKLIRLLNPGEPENYINLDPGEEVKLATYPHRVSVTSMDGKYIGRLPDDVAARLRGLIKDGNKYQVLIKCISPREKEITIFIRETQKGVGSANVPSFPPEKIDYVAFTPPELVHSDVPDVETTEEIPEE